MKALTYDETKVHQKKLRTFERKRNTVRARWYDGAITKVKHDLKLKEINHQELSYVNNCKIILYFGKCYRDEN